MEYSVRGFLIFLGLLLVLGGGAVAAAQYSPVDLSMLDSVAGAKDFLLSPMALYAGGGAAGFGLLLIIIAAATGGKKKEKPAIPAPKAKAVPVKAEKVVAAEPFEAKPAPKAEAPKPAPKPAPAPQPAPFAAAPKPAPAPQPVAAAPALQPAPVRKPASAPAPQPAPAPAPKPVASGQPPASAAVDTRASDPRLMNRKRVSDLVSINDALKAYHKQNGVYPRAGGLAGFADRGAAWIPGLSPDFIAELPRDPAQSSDKSGPQYVYASDGKDYKLLAQGVSLIGGTNVEVLGVRIDPTRQPTPENCSFGYWTEGFAGA